MVFFDAVFENLSVADYPDRDFISVSTNPIWMIVNVPDLHLEVMILLKLTNHCLGNCTKVAILTGIEDQLDHLTMLA